MITRSQFSCPFLLAFVLATIMVGSITALAQAVTPLNDPAIEARISALLRQMTLEEKLGQLNQFSGGGPTGPTDPSTGRSNYKQMIARGQIGSILNVTGAKETNELQRIAMTQSRLKIPILFGLDVIHGYRTIFPVPLGLASTWNPDLVERTAAAAAREASSEGVRWTFSPMVDIARDARWGRIVEGAGEDPFLGSIMAAAYVRGYQGTRLDDPFSIAACAKHYVGYGAAEGGRDYNTTEIPDRLLREVYLPPFRAAVDAGAATLMSAFNAVNGVPASANPFTLDQVLRREWGFRGFVVSDWTSVKEVIPHGIANDGATAARKAILAGVDMDMEGGLYLNELALQVESGKVPLPVVDEAVRRILRVKFALGLFERPYVEESAQRKALDPAHVELARMAAEESFVLLKNDARAGQASLLPLGAGVRTIALIGPLADSAGDMLGAWAGKGDPKDAITMRAALEEFAAKRQMQLLYAKGTEIAGGSDAGIAPAVDVARRADVVLLALGENAGEMTAEAASRAFITLPGWQEKLLEAVAATGKPVVLVVFSGRPLALTSVVDRVGAIIQAWHPGIQAGPALVRVLSGEANFTGRLTVTMPRSVGQQPLYYNHLNTGRPAGKVDLTRPPATGEEKFVSRYVDEQNAPLFPFGYGLSYTRFEYSPITLSTKSLSARALNSGSQTLRVAVEVRNVGGSDGVEVAQLYIRHRGTSVARPVRELKGFQRIALRAGESRRVEFTLSKKELAFWNIDMKEVVEPAVVTVWVGHDSQSGSHAEVAITE
ncbi:MAG: glycoside hydrolase family 3 N-terminal domain-containing protein [Pyrinomonadaceae bacterium]